MTSPPRAPWRVLGTRAGSWQLLRGHDARVAVRSVTGSFRRAGGAPSPCPGPRPRGSTPDPGCGRRPFRRPPTPRGRSAPGAGSSRTCRNRRLAWPRRPLAFPGSGTGRRGTASPPARNRWRPEPWPRIAGPPAPPCRRRPSSGRAGRRERHEPPPGCWGCARRSRPGAQVVGHRRLPLLVRAIRLGESGPGLPRRPFPLFRRPGQGVSRLAESPARRTRSSRLREQPGSPRLAACPRRSARRGPRGREDPGGGAPRAALAPPRPGAPLAPAGAHRCRPKPRRQEKGERSPELHYSTWMVTVATLERAPPLSFTV